MISSLKQKSPKMFTLETMRIVYQNSGAGRSSGYREPSPQEIEYQAQLHRKFPKIMNDSQTLPIQNNYSRPVAMIFNNDMSSIDSTINPNFHQNDTKSYLSATTTKNDGTMNNVNPDFKKSIDSLQSSITSLHLKMEEQQKKITTLEKKEEPENTSIKRKLDSGETEDVEIKIRMIFENRFKSIESTITKLKKSSEEQTTNQITIDNSINELREQSNTSLQTLRE